MKLVQLNAWGGRLENQIMELLRHESADFVCLQEAISMKGKTVLTVSVEQLQERLNYPSAFLSPVFSFNLMNKKALFGNVLLSKEKPSSEETIFTNLEYTDGFDFDTHDYNIRNLQHAQFDVGDKKLHILNHHGHHIGEHKNGDEQTLRQMRQIRDYIEKLDGAVVLCGDFNLSPHSESIELLNDMLRNLSIENKLETTRTQLTHKKEVCDFIFVNDQVKVRSFGAADEVVSDHKALILEFDI